MKSLYCVILVVSGTVWTSNAPGLNAQVATEFVASSTGCTSVEPSSAAARASASSGIATGYRGHYTCRHFTGIDRKLAIAVSDQEPAIVAKLLQSGADINARSDAFRAQGMTMLQTAVLHEWGLESIRLLIEAGADVNARDRRGETALTIACRNPLGSNLPTVARLMRAGAAVDAGGAKAMTPLMCAALYDDTALVVKTLLEATADVTARDNLGWTALMHATRRRREHIEIVHILAKAGSDVNARHRFGGTALSNAAYNGHTQSVRFFISAGANVNSRDDANWTPLICSSMNGHLHIVKLLLESGADVNDADRLGRTALNVAGSNGHKSVEKLLIESGARK